jgi:hypothetical protein
LLAGNRSYKMAIYTKIVKISQKGPIHTYAIYNNSEIIDCYAIVDDENKNMKIYRDPELKNLIFDYKEMNEHPEHIWPEQPLFMRALLNLIPTLKNGSYPDDLSRCS